MSTQGRGGELALLVTFDGERPVIDDTAWVAPTATLIGPVRLEADASAWYGVVMRADVGTITIGAGSNVQDNSVVHTGTDLPVVLGARVSVGHGVVLHGCTVEDDVLVGMGATVLNGARIGRGSLIAAGALVREGTQIPPGSLVTGVPGKVRRTLTEEETARVLANSQEYVDLAARYRAMEA